MGRKISLKYFDMMEEMGLIVDLYDPDHDLHLFQLGQAGYILLGLEHIPYQRLPLLVEHKQKGRILAFARWARKNGIEVDLEAKQNPSFIYFICKGNIIAYFKGYISPEQIIELYQEYVPTEIDELPIELSPKTAETYSTQGTTKEIAKALKKHAPK
jgi:hypothetical protein